jgi:hypothetical protein
MRDACGSPEVMRTSVLIRKTWRLGVVKTRFAFVKRNDELSEHTIEIALSAWHHKSIEATLTCRLDSGGYES